MQAQQPTIKAIETEVIRSTDNKVLIEWRSTSKKTASEKNAVLEALKQASKAVRQ